MISINTNRQSLIILHSLKSSTLKLNQAIERMSSGYKINRAKDNAANYAITTNMSTKISAYQVAEDNAAMGLDMVNIANESLNSISDKLTRIRALAEQAANGTYGKQSLSGINKECNALISEIQREYSNTEYNGIKLFGSSSKLIDSVERRDTSGMMSLSEIDETKTLAKGTYSISTVEELVKLSSMQNNRKITKGSEFVLADDIDMSSVDNFTPIGKRSLCAFEGIFDGNGYVISNLKEDPVQDKTYETNGLFGYVYGEIKNLAIENANVSGTTSGAGILVGILGNGNNYGKITNCYTTGEVSGDFSVGGLIGQVRYGEVRKCYSTANATANGNAYTNDVGGLIGTIRDNGATIDKCYANGNAITNGNGFQAGFIGAMSSGSSSLVTITNSYSESLCGTFIGAITGTTTEITNCYLKGNPNGSTGKGFICNFGNSNQTCTINNCAVLGGIKDLQGIFMGGNWCGNPNVVFNNCSYSKEYEDIPLQSNSYGTITFNNITICDNEKPFDYEGESLVSIEQNINFQIGAEGNNYSQLTFSPTFILSMISDLRQIGKNNENSLEKIDVLLAKIQTKQSEFGAMQNRLESALDEISTKYENFVSSHSTLKDADIAKISSEYIKQQILQQASATLLATANQSPALALQLLPLNISSRTVSIVF